MSPSRSSKPGSGSVASAGPLSTSPFSVTSSWASPVSATLDSFTSSVTTVSSGQAGADVQRHLRLRRLRLAGRGFPPPGLGVGGEGLAAPVAGAGRLGLAPGAGPLGARGIAAAAPAAPAGAATASMRRMTSDCWPMLHTLVVSQYRSTPSGNRYPNIAKLSG